MILLRILVVREQVAGDVPFIQDACDVLPFLFFDLFRIVLLALFPVISLCLLSL